MLHQHLSTSIDFFFHHLKPFIPSNISMAKLKDHCNIFEPLLTSNVMGNSALKSPLPAVDSSVRLVQTLNQTVCKALIFRKLKHEISLLNSLISEHTL